MKRLSFQVIACALAVAVTGMAVWFGLLYAKHGSVAFRCGILATTSDQFLDNSGRAFQKCTWHLGIGTRTWGETYGLKVGRVYVSMYLKHINPRLTSREAREDE